VDKGQFLVESQLRTGLPVAELARAHGINRSWLYKLLARYSREGPAGVAPRSRRPHHSPTRIAGRWEEEITAVRKELLDAGLDAGAETIRVHLARRHRAVPSVSTIWRVLRARGFVTPSHTSAPQGAGQPATKLSTMSRDIVSDVSTHHMVGMAGFEPAASCSQSRRANQAAPHPARPTVAYLPGVPWGGRDALHRAAR
jgi:transposase-like protein